MLTMNEFVDLRMQQQIAQEIYRQQIMQRIPDPFHPMLPIPMTHHIIMPPRPSLPGVEAKLENDELWQQFHAVGTEMIITKSGRRMFPSMRVTVAGLEEESNYCVLLEMVPIGDCRYKFSGSQWVPAGGAEPQSPQRMFLHPDSPATGAHWQSQAILFNKVKLTNNTLDSSGHIVLASMHKYQPRLHIIRTSDLGQIPWAPQQAFVFPETEFVAVTAYQNDRTTRLKIDHNPFAKGFRESGQSRCKRKLSSHSDERDATVQSLSPSKAHTNANATEDDRSSVGSFDSPQAKRAHSNSSLDDEACYSSNVSNGTMSPRFDEVTTYQHPSAALLYQSHIQPLMRPSPMDLATAAYFSGAPHPMQHMLAEPISHHLAPQHYSATAALYAAAAAVHSEETQPDLPVAAPASVSTAEPTQPVQAKRNNFSISAILAF